MKRKGFIYTIFVIFVLSLLFMILANPLNFRSLDSPGDRIRVNEQYYFLRSIEDDFRRANHITGKRAITAATNHVLGEEEPLQGSEEAIEEAFLNGTINGTESALMENSTIKNWILSAEEVANSSNFEGEIELNNFELIPSGEVLKVNVSYNIYLRDHRVESVFDVNKSYLIDLSYEEIEDSLIYFRSKGSYGSSYKFTNFSKRAYNALNGSNYYYNTSKNWTSGRAVVGPTDLNSVSDKEEKILVAEDPCVYNTTKLNMFQGVLSEDSMGCDLDISYIENIGSFQDVFMDDMVLVMDDNEVWVNNILDEMRNNLYFVDPVGEAPTFLDRLENNSLGIEDSGGIARFLEVSSLPSELQKTDSAVDYKYWNGESNQLYKIKGVSDHRTWFRLDEEHVEAWNITELAYN